MLRNDEALSKTWSDQPGCLPRVNLQLPHKDHFNYTVQTSLKSPIFSFVYLGECHINWLITVFLSHFQRTHGEEGEKGKEKAVNASLLKRKKDRHGGMKTAGCSLKRGWQKRGAMQLELMCCSRMAETGQVGWWDGQLQQQCTGGTGRGMGAQWDPALAQQHSPDHDPAHPPALRFCAVRGSHPALLRQMRGSRFSRGVIPFTCILCCIIQE